jgi:methylated-DNA-protein-cysteine methyltransferase-like protein
MTTKPLSQKNSDFFATVFDVVRCIPEGRVTSYGAIAKYLGSARSSRMVGWAMNASHAFPDIPAHRVVNRNGLLTGKMHFSPPESMQARLETEGIRVENDQIVEFTTLFWEPLKELSIE